jgi:hypothetical protein
VGGTLADVLALAETEGCNAAKDHLGPGEERHQLANDGVTRADQFPDLAINALFPMELEVKTQSDLSGEGDLEDVGEDAVDVVGDESSTAVSVAQEEAQDGKDGAEDLRRNVPSRLAQLHEEG